MNLTKKELKLNGNLLRPLKVGHGAIIHADGKICHTSRVVAVYEQTKDHIRFETLNARYHLQICPFPQAAACPLPDTLAACA